MATAAPPISSPVAPSSHVPPPGRPSSAPTTGINNALNSGLTEHVSETAYEFLLAEILLWVERDETRIAHEAQRVQLAAQKLTGHSDPTASSAMVEENAAVMAAERSAARIERMGYDVGYRFCERLAQHRPLAGLGSASPESATAAESQLNPPVSGTSNIPIVIGGGGHSTYMDPKTQLEAVKFLCKEFWMEVLGKQIDKLQTNHRGVFVLKDLDLKWLRRLPPDDEMARVGAIRILAFPCGLIRGALACLGMSGAVVSCDFLADGKTMSSCSFNIKVK